MSKQEGLNEYLISLESRIKILRTDLRRLEAELKRTREIYLDFCDSQKDGFGPEPHKHLVVVGFENDITAQQKEVDRVKAEIVRVEQSISIYKMSAPPDGVN